MMSQINRYVVFCASLAFVCSRALYSESAGAEGTLPNVASGAEYDEGYDDDYAGDDDAPADGSVGNSQAPAAGFDAGNTQAPAGSYVAGDDNSAPGNGFAGSGQAPGNDDYATEGDDATDDGYATDDGVPDNGFAGNTQAPTGNYVAGNDGAPGSDYTGHGRAPDNDDGYEAEDDDAPDDDFAGHGNAPAAGSDAGNTQAPAGSYAATDNGAKSNSSVGNGQAPSDSNARDDGAPGNDYTGSGNAPAVGSDAGNTQAPAGSYAAMGNGAQSNSSVGNGQVPGDSNSPDDGAPGNDYTGSGNAPAVGSDAGNTQAPAGSYAATDNGVQSNSSVGNGQVPGDGSASAAGSDAANGDIIGDNSAPSDKVPGNVVVPEEFKQTPEDEKLEKQAVEEEKKSDTQPVDQSVNQFADSEGKNSASQEEIETNTQSVDQSVDQLADQLAGTEGKYPAPKFDKLVPVSGWDRYSCDSASTVSQWFRWWKYLRFEKPVYMSWINGLVLKLYPKNEICRALFVRGVYNPNQLVVINSLLPKGGVMVDAGCNIGYSLLLASATVGKSGHIFALEPSKRDFDRLLENVKLNRADDVISVYRYAVLDKKGSANLMVAYEERSSLNTLGTEFSVKGVENLAPETVETTSIDDFVFEKKINKVDLLELDIKGSEYLALKGSVKTIERDHPAIVLGINESALKSCGTKMKVKDPETGKEEEIVDSHISDIKKLLKDLKYRAYKIVEFPAFALEEVRDIEKEHEKVVYCLHESLDPPALPQPEKKSMLCRICCAFQ
ncbi:hypothetical protein FACS189472_07110 [Alphaproteobacteria bacterium]|nr:hypothetical protein FACS189472_07110 [Alphaproteobacteria bacterium]